MALVCTIGIGSGIVYYRRNLRRPRFIIYPGDLRSHLPQVVHLVSYDNNLGVIRNIDIQKSPSLVTLDRSEYQTACTTPIEVPTAGSVQSPFTPGLSNMNFDGCHTSTFNLKEKCEDEIFKKCNPKIETPFDCYRKIMNKLRDEFNVYMYNKYGEEGVLSYVGDLELKTIFPSEIKAMQRRV